MSSLYVSCVALLEDSAAELYEKLVKRCENNQVKLILLEILYETKKHGELLRHIHKMGDGEETIPSYGKCEKEMGSLFRDSLELITHLRKQVERGKEPIKSIIMDSINFEKGFGEEYSSGIYAKISSLVETSPTIKEVFNHIAEDEKRHVKMLQLASKLLSWQ
ncbi:MAG: hypothetical protein V1850_01045 [Candidatus Bathyarchaeota archaeon]